MPTFSLNRLVRLTFKTYSDSAETTLGDPTEVNFDVLAPGATSPATHTWPSGDVVRESLGVFHIEVLASTDGHWEAHAEATGAITTSEDWEWDVTAEYLYGFVSVDDFAVYVNNPDLDRSRARAVLDLAQQLCETITTPLPAGAGIVVMDVAERAYSNPTALQSQGLGFYNDEGTAQTSVGGLYLTRENKATLKRLKGSSRAFTIDVMPSTAGQNLPWWDVNQTSTDVATS